ncbi:hypothetical protein ACU686_05135 [Yinghuangia aomiensis]
MSIALELAELRRSVDVGFARVDGQLALFLQRADQTDQKLTDHEQRLDALERSRWPVASIGVLTGIAGIAVAVWQAVGH